MPELQAAATDSWQDATDIQAAADDSWQDATEVQSVGSTYAPPGAGGGTVIVPGSLQALNDIAPANTYSVSNTLTVLDYRDDSALPVDAVSLALQEGSAHWTLTASGPSALAAAVKAGEQPAVVEVRINSDVWRFAVDQVDQPLGFGSTAVSLRGTSLASLAGAPHQIERTWLADSPTTAAQVATVAHTYTGLAVDWRVTDWLIPEGAWSYTGDPFGVVMQMAGAVAAEVESHPSEMSVMVKPKYATLPNLWATTRPDWQIAWLAVEGASQARADKPEYDAVVLTGQQAGDVLVARLEGTSGANQAPLISDPLLTDVAAMNQRATALLAGYGKQTRETRTLQVHGRVIQRGELVRNVDPDETWSGVVRGVSVTASLGQARQTVVMERHTAFTLGSAAPEPIPPPACEIHPDPSKILLLARFDGDFADSSAYNRTPTLFGAPSIATSGQKFGAGAGDFDGSSYVRFPANANWAIAGDCTFSFWIRPTSLPTGLPRMIAAWFDPSYSEQLWFRQELDGRIGVGVPGYGGANRIESPAVAVGQLTHIALVRNGATVKLFANGVSLGTTWTNSSNMGHNSFAYYVGGTTNSNYDKFIGLIDDFEVIGGLALWSTEFTPPINAWCALGSIPAPAIFHAPLTVGVNDTVGGYAGVAVNSTNMSYGSSGLTYSAFAAFNQYVIYETCPLFSPAFGSHRKFSLTATFPHSADNVLGPVIRFFQIGWSTNYACFAVRVDSGATTIVCRAAFGSTTDTVVAAPVGAALYEIDFNGDTVSWLINGAAVRTLVVAVFPSADIAFIGPVNGTPNGLTTLTLRDFRAYN